MTSFQAYSSGGPTSLQILGLGLAGVLAIYGLGAPLLRAARIELSLIWGAAVGCVTGVMVLSSVTFALAMTSFGVATFLVPIWWAAVASGALFAFRAFRRAGPPRWLEGTSVAEKAGYLVFGIAITSNLLVALAPSSKIDELHYHMLLPSRVVSDGVLHYYAGPWPAAILPQMHFQLASTALHKLGCPDAPNVISWAFGVILAGLAIFEVSRNPAHRPLAPWLAAALSVGLYPAVQWVTGGPHAMQDLAIAAALLLVLFSARWIAEVGEWQYTLLVSILAVGMSATKIIFLPLAVAAAVAAVYFGLHGSAPSQPNQLVPVLLAAAVPWLVFHVPLALWTFHASGSPLGPVMAGWFGPSLFGKGEMSLLRAGTIAANTRPAGTILFNLLTGSSPLLWLAAAIPLLARNIPTALRGLAVAALALQVLVIALAIHLDPRFLGGIPYGLAIAGLAMATTSRLVTFARSRRTWFAPLATVPWLCLQLYYSGQFMGPSLGLEGRETFLREKTSFRADFLALDRLLPRDAVLLIAGDTRINSVYVCRGVILDRRDLPRNKKAFVFEVTSPDSGVPRSPLQANLVYENRHAVQEVYRTPGRSPRIGSLQVRELQSEA